MRLHTHYDRRFRYLWLNQRAQTEVWTTMYILGYVIYGRLKLKPLLTASLQVCSLIDQRARPVTVSFKIDQREHYPKASMWSLH